MADENDGLNLEELDPNAMPDGDGMVAETPPPAAKPEPDEFDGNNPDAWGEQALMEEEDAASNKARDLEAVYDIPVEVSAVLGKSTMRVSQLLKLGRGAVVELDRKVGEAIDIYVNNRLVARGEVVVVEDRLGVTMTEIVKTERR
jgi:flagellar motor switch protein FliN/FliY